ncbi:hypothetical protein KVR01_013580 [Diaporthe batatas]|uniref:uncharacterized protein n=1 Tax=Diaporthe batatas TaxID=748121 RepID=UPI001D055BA1|nr:uncharacterized protein KVR01_013580 [Diaporthe batatas]KAG8156476.1 hypothetical protein KVR01_013580 [Diaporthe batatas]
MDSSDGHAQQAGPSRLVGKIVQDCIQIQHNQREALSVGIYQTPRVEDKPVVNHQRIHDIDDDRHVALQFFDAQMTSKWTPPSTTRHDPFALDFLVPVKRGTAVSLRVFNVASDSMYKYQVFAGGVNVARPTPIGIRQDYFVAPAHEWVYGTRFASDPCIVRQFQLLKGKSGFSLASVLSKDDTIKCVEVQISSRKRSYEATGTCDIQANEQQSSGTSYTHILQSTSAEDASLAASTLPTTDGEETVTGDAVKEPETNKLVSIPPKRHSIPGGFEVHLAGSNFIPIHVRNMHGKDLVEDLKMRIEEQEGIPINMQRVFLAGTELGDVYPLELFGICAATRDLYLLIGERLRPRTGILVDERTSPQSHEEGLTSDEMSDDMSHAESIELAIDRARRTSRLPRPLRQLTRPLHQHARPIHQHASLHEHARPLPQHTQPLHQHAPEPPRHRLVSSRIRSRWETTQVLSPVTATTSEEQHLMDICPGGLVRQKFTLDDNPEQWYEYYEGALRIHLIDEEQFEKVTGLRRDTSNNVASQAQNASLVFGPPAPRRFVRESETPGGLPSVAQMWVRTRREKARARVPPTTTSTTRQLELDIEEPKTQRSAGKLAKYFFICGK